MELIYKIVPQHLWREAERNGTFAGTALDQRDGFIHFSTAAQVHATAAKHFAGQGDLLLVGIDPGKLGDRLRFETSRQNALFPHLYGTFEPAAASFVRPLPLSADGVHCFDLDP